MISNAIKFTKESGTITVRPRWERVNKQLRYDAFELQNGKTVQFLKVMMMHLDVTDNGVGMTAEQLSNLFGKACNSMSISYKQGNVVVWVYISPWA